MEATVRMYIDDIKIIKGTTMGTHYQVSLPEAQAFDPELADEIHGAVSSVDDQMTTWRESDLMRLNQAPTGAWVHLPEDLIFVLETAMAMNALSQGVFDINVGEMVEAWGFHARRSPDETQITDSLIWPHQRLDEVLEIDAMNLRTRKIFRSQFDLSGIAKGYGVDKIAETLADRGIQDALIAIDGELRAMGQMRQGQPWVIGVERPNDELRDVDGIIELRDLSVASSGNYRQFHFVNGTRVAHTINPLTRMPAQSDLAGVTVFHESCMLADAWATVLMVLGEENGKALARRNQIEAIYFRAQG